MFRKTINKRSWKVTGFILSCFLLQLNTGCQRDDICPESTQTTPLLNISFFDALETDIPKPPVNLTVRSIDFDTIILRRVNDVEISIPLRTDVNATEYEFILNAPATTDDGEVDDNSNTDVINFTYTPEEIYINRACSFKVNYLNLNARVRSEDDDNTWIRLISVEEENIENETITHIIIYH